jgi:hypothetical protein
MPQYKNYPRGQRPIQRRQPVRQPRSPLRRPVDPPVRGSVPFLAGVIGAIGIIAILALAHFVITNGKAPTTTPGAKTKSASPVVIDSQCRVLPRDQLRSLATEVGWRGDNINIAVAVAMAESSGKTCSKGDVNLENATWGPSIGLWQIRSLRSQKGTGGVRDETANYDPRINARHAYQIWSGEGGSWQPWSTWNNGAYRAYI